MHEVGEIMLDLALVYINDLEAVLNQELLTFDGLGCLTAVIALDLAEERRDSRIVGQADEKVEDGNLLVWLLPLRYGALEQCLRDGKRVLGTVGQ